MRRKGSRPEVHGSDVLEDADTGEEYAVNRVEPRDGGFVAAETRWHLDDSGLHIPRLVKLQVNCLDVVEDASRLYREFISPYLRQRQLARKLDGGAAKPKALTLVEENSTLVIFEKRFGVRATEPAVRHGVVDEETLVYVDVEPTPELHRIHILPYQDTLPQGYRYDLFKDYLQPYLQRNVFTVFQANDHFFFQGVRFRVMAADPVAGGRVGPRTTIFSEGALQPGLRDLLPLELQQELASMPPGLQMLLLSTMEQSDALTRLAEAQSVQEALRRGGGLSAAELARQGAAPFAWKLPPAPAPATLTAAPGAPAAPAAAREVCSSCMVCLSEFLAGERCRRLPCSHVFHQACIDEWLTRANSCPICKGPGVQAAATPGAAAPPAGGAAAAVAAGAQDASAAIVPAGSEVVLYGLVARPELNGRRGTVVGAFDATRGRYTVELERSDGLDGGGGGASSSSTFEAAAHSVSRVFSSVASALGLGEDEGAPRVAVRQSQFVQRLRGVRLLDGAGAHAGATGRIAGYDPGSGCYEVEFPVPAGSAPGASASARLPRGSLVPPVGSVVRVVGLARSTQHNESPGRVLAFDEPTKRLRLEVEAPPGPGPGGLGAPGALRRPRVELRVKPENVVC